MLDSNYKFIMVSEGGAHRADFRDYSQWPAAIAGRQINLLSNWQHSGFPGLTEPNRLGAMGDFAS
jgi:hypothetical protein